MFSFVLLGLSHDFAINRTIPYLFFFLLGYHIQPEQFTALKTGLTGKKWFPAIAFALIGCCCAAIYAIYHSLATEQLSFAGLLGLIGHSKSCVDAGIGLRGGFLFSIALFFATITTSAALVLVTPKKQCFLSEIGRDTLPLYLSHMLIQLLYGRIQRRFFFFDSWTVNYLLSFIPIALCVIVFSCKGYRRLFHKCIGWIPKIICKDEGAT